LNILWQRQRMDIDAMHGCVPFNPSISPNQRKQLLCHKHGSLSIINGV